MGRNLGFRSRRLLLRVVVWLIILVTPSASWLAFTHDGRGVWHRLFARDTRAENRAIVGADVGRPSRGLRPEGGIVLSPAACPPTHPQLRVQLYANQTTGLIVADPKGRRSGIAWRTLSPLHEIPNAHVRRKLLGQGGGAKFELVTVTVDPAASSIYTLSIAAKRPGDFRLAVAGVSPALKGTSDFESDRVPAATVLHYRIDLNNIHPLPVSLFGPPRGVREAVIKPAEEFVARTKSEVIEPTDPALVAAAAAITKDPCGYFYKKLQGIPYERFTRTNGAYESLWDGATRHGCQVVLVTTDRLRGGKGVPSFSAMEGTFLYKLGWRMDNALAADGPGDTDFGIENRTRLCSIFDDQPGEIDPKTDKYIHSKTLTLTIQCRRK